MTSLKRTFHFFILMFMPFVSFFCFIVLVRTSRKMCNRSGESKKIYAIISSNIFFYTLTFFLPLWDSVIYMCNYTCRYCSTGLSVPFNFYFKIFYLCSSGLIIFTYLPLSYFFLFFSDCFSIFSHITSVFYFIEQL